MDVNVALTYIVTLWLFATTEDECAKLSEESGHRVVSFKYGFCVLKISECCCKPVCYTIEKELATMQLITNLLVGLGMVELALVDYFVMGEAKCTYIFLLYRFNA